jgi:hypothetical protein
MLGANLVLAGMGILFATETLVPVVIGGLFGLGVAVLGLLLLQNKPAGTAQARHEVPPQFPDVPAQGEPGQPQPPEAIVIQGRNPIWSLVVPGLGALAITGAIFWIVIPIYQDWITARDNAREAMNPSNWNLSIPHQQVVMPPIQFQQLPQIQFQPPKIQPIPIQVNIPPPPRIQQPYIRTR